MNNKNNDGTGIVATAIVLFFLGLFFIIKFTVIGIIMIISSIAIWILNNNKKHENEEEPKGLNVSDMIKETIDSGQKRKNFKTEDGIDVEIVIDDEDIGEDDDD